MQKTLGRPKSFDNDEILSLAMHHFWINGYDNSSLDDLLKVMGIKKSSFYRTFKSKEELFSMALDLYSKELFNSVERLRAEISTKDILIKLVTSALRNPSDSSPVKGCLLLNSGKECYCKHNELSKKIKLQFNSFIDFFTQLIQEAKDKKQILNPLDSKAIASRYISTFNGLFVMIKAGADEEMVESIVASIHELLE